MTDDLLEPRHAAGSIPAACLSARVIVEGVRDLEAELRRRGQSLVLELPGDAVRVRGDAVRLGQVVTNLLENASQYPGAGDRISVCNRGPPQTPAGGSIGMPDILSIQSR